MDVGANVGIYTDIFARRSKRVIAVEPHPSCARHLRALKIERAVIVEAAASDQNGFATLRTPIEFGRANHALGSIAQNNAMKDADDFEIIRVEKARLDQIIAEHATASDKLSLVKIDVEGHEQQVLGGMVETLESRKPVLMIEIEYRHGAPVNAIFELLADFGYAASVAIDAKFIPTTPSHLATLQSAELLQAKQADPRFFGYVNNVFFIPRGPPR